MKDLMIRLGVSPPVGDIASNPTANEMANGNTTKNENTHPVDDGTKGRKDSKRPADKTIYNEFID